MTIFVHQFFTIKLIITFNLNRPKQSSAEPILIKCHISFLLILQELYTHPYRFDLLFSLLSFLVLKTQTQEGRLENKHGDTRAKCISPVAFRRVLHSHLLPSLQQFSLNLCTTTVNYRGYTLFSLSSLWAFHSLFQMLLKGRLFP